MKKYLFILISISCLSTYAQPTFPVNGPKNENHNYYAFTNAHIFIDYQTEIKKGTLLIKDGVVIKAGEGIEIPKSTVVYDLKGKYIYPSFIDPFTSYGLPPTVKAKNAEWPQMESATKGAYNWNQAIKPEYDAFRNFTVNDKEADELRKLGFGSVVTFQRDGIARGTGAVVTLADERENKCIIKTQASANYAFEKGTSTQDYPSSLMGAIALIRQTYYDAQWYRNNKKEANLSLEAWNNSQGFTQVFDAKDKLSVLRAEKIAREFNVKYVYKTTGDEYQLINDLKSTGASFIVPLNFPAAYDVEDPYAANLVSLADMMHWELAPSNPSVLEKNKIDFALTTADLKNKKDFWANLLKSIEYGLSPQQALKSLTYTPAKLFGVEAVLGNLKPGSFANFIITSSNVFDKKNTIHENWIEGRQYKINDYNVTDVRGNYKLTVGDSSAFAFTITGDLYKPQGDLLKVNMDVDTARFRALILNAKKDTTKVKAFVTVSGSLININYVSTGKAMVRLSGTIESGNNVFMYGRGQLASGEWVNWKADFVSAYVEDVKKDTSADVPLVLGSVVYPFMPYGQVELPKQESVLIKNATVWTNEQQGILQNADVLFESGKIKAVGKNLSGGTRVIDATGKHVTTGIIDEHSHIAISQGVNEGAQASSAEVRIGDVLNSEDINIYRQLAGGVTAAQLLHGSANPIGGQSAIIKLRWGLTPEALKIQGADGYIKFALGENVKQSNWGDKFVVRYPQSRMGVEQVFYDHFIRAKEYQSKLKAATVGGKPIGTKPRKDLDLEALSEILNNKRFITCHSYVQSEINMLMHVADSMDFTVNTFTHILEGYKVADKMKNHGAGGSTFSDWWAYKMEVNDAIPQNAAIMHNMGIVTAINSDDAEMARRLNQEAAKSVKYGNVSEEEALKFVTLNPAKLLHLDDRMGSIKPGKDADIVIWSDNPLSIYARAEKTFVDGALYYDLEKNVILRAQIAKERTRLIQKMIAEKGKGESSQQPSPKGGYRYTCDMLESDYNQ